MHIKNFFRLPEWEIHDLLAVVVTLLTIYFVCIFTEMLGLELNIIKNFVSFFIILFIPGILFLRIIKFDSLENNLETVLYSLGLSLVILMTLGFAMNVLYPFVGINNPLSGGIFITTLNVLIMLMCFVVYLLDDNSYKTPLMDLKFFTSNQAIFLMILPFLSVIGAYFMNYYHSNIFFMILIPLICFTGLMVAFQKYLTHKYYPMAVLCISLALLFHNSLISNYIWGWDISFEYFMSQNIINSGYWFMNIPNNYNSMLSVVIIAPAMSDYIGLNLVWVLKIIYPFIFAFLPVALYFAFKKQTNPPVAFLSVFFFVSLFTFYTEMLAVVRQIVAEVFLGMVILLMVSSNLNNSKRSALAILFSLSIVISHYGLAYILLFAMLFSMIILVMENQLKFVRTFIMKLISKVFPIKIIPFRGSNNEKEVNAVNNWIHVNKNEIDSPDRTAKFENFKNKLNWILFPFTHLFKLTLKAPGNLFFQIKHNRINRKIFYLGRFLFLISFLTAWQTYSSPGNLKMHSFEDARNRKMVNELNLVSKLRIKIIKAKYSLRNMELDNFALKNRDVSHNRINDSIGSRNRLKSNQIVLNSEMSELPMIETETVSKTQDVPPVPKKDHIKTIQRSFRVIQKHTVNKISLKGLNFSRPNINFNFNFFKALKSRLTMKKSLSVRIKKHKIDSTGQIFNGTMILLFATFLLTWYIYTSSSSAMISILNIGNDIVKNILSMMDPNASQGLSLVLTQQKSLFRDFHKYLYLSSQFFVFLGLIALIFHQTNLKFTREFKALALGAFLLLVGGIVVPFLASQMNTSRMLHIALIFLAPFLIIGIFFALKIIRRYLNRPNPSYSLKLVGIYLVIFLLMDSGMAYVFVPHEDGISISFSNAYDFPKFNDQELQSAKWLKSEFGEKGIYADKHRSCVLRSIFPACEEVPPYLDLVKPNFYVYFGTINIQKGLYIYKMTGANVIQEIGYTNPSKIVDNRPKIYDNGGSVIYGRSG